MTSNRSRSLSGYGDRSGAWSQVAPGRFRCPDYQSFHLAQLALVSVPLGFIGVFPGHWLLGPTFSSASMVGVITLDSVVVRNSLLIIDFSRDYQHLTYTVEDAAREAGAARMLPILLTTLTTWIMGPEPVSRGLAIACFRCGQLGATYYYYCW